MNLQVADAGMVSRTFLMQAACVSISSDGAQTVMTVNLQGYQT